MEQAMGVRGMGARDKPCGPVVVARNVLQGDERDDPWWEFALAGLGPRLWLFLAAILWIFRIVASIISMETLMKGPPSHH